MYLKKPLNYIPVFVFILFLIIECSLFKQYVLREIAWVYPTWADQAQYLASTYKLFEKILNTSLFQALWTEIFTPNPKGSLILIEGAIAFLFGGPSRLNALTINLIHFIFFQTTAAYVFYKLTKSWNFGLILLSLTASLNFIYTMPGGIFDFRIDFISFCLYGIAALVFLRTNFLTSIKWTVIWSFACAICVITRYNTCVYFIVVWIVLFLYILLELFLVKKTRKVLYRKLTNCMLSIFCFLILILPFFITNYRAFLDYYIHQSTVRGPIRLAGQKINTFIDLLTYYPKQIIFEKLGFFALLIILILCIWIIGLTIYQRKNYFSRAGFAGLFDYNNFGANLVFLSASIAVPIIVLTLNPAKSSVVGGIVVFPIAIFLVYSFFHLFVFLAMKKSNYIAKLLLTFVTILFISSSFGFILERYSSISRESKNKFENQKLMEYYRSFYELCYKFQIKNPSLINNYIHHRYEPIILSVIAYEEIQFQITPKQIGRKHQILAMDKEKILKAANSVDFIVIVENEHKRNMHFPYNQVLNDITPELKKITCNNFRKAGKWLIFNESIDLYINNKYH